MADVELVSISHSFNLEASNSKKLLGEGFKKKQTPNN